MIRWGILSTAKIGIEQLIPAILDSRNGIVHAIASRDLEKAQSVAERFDIANALGSYDELLARDDIDAVYIPLLTSQHVEWSIKAANAGKHVLCEKPIALHAGEIDDIIKARDKNNVIVSEAFMVTYNPQWHKVRELITSGAIGKLKHVQSVFSYNNPDPNNMRNIKDYGGGALPDIGVYPTVTTRFATGCEPKNVSATVEFHPVFKTDSYATCRADFGEFEMTMYVSTQMALRQEIAFHGDKGWITLDAPFNAGLYGDHMVTLNNVDHTQQSRFRFPGINQYQLQVEAFGDAVKGEALSDGNEIFSLENSVMNQKLIDAIYRAGETGEWETV